MLSGTTLLVALLGGILPALLWLWFWLKEDKARPEPRGLIMLAFITGMITVPLVVPLERMACDLITQNTQCLSANSFQGILLIFIWSAIEELMKYGGAALTVLRRRAVDEPLDPIIYMITVALGFAALENTFFLLNPNLNIFGGIITGNLRFLGATLLHTLASASIGLAMAYSFYKTRAIKFVYVLIGIALSIILHALFNFFIISTNGDKILTVFAFVWIGIILLLLSFEKVKRITRLTMRN